ncbi:MAG: hypothetical protein J6W28_01870, partial [Clostridia bacterium]|nr:hypothetical protein [Clostridia bacterium]
IEGETEQSENPYYRNGTIHLLDVSTPTEENATTPIDIYANWDVIMHEYGHHIQEQLNLRAGPGVKHDSTKNQIDELENKSDGIRLAWKEAWATVFALLAQDEYSDLLQGIPLTCSSEKTNFEGNTTDVETISSTKGEGCEESIMAVLWDVFDFSYDEENDAVSLGHNDFWDITTISGTTTFSAFIANFYAEYPEHIHDIGLNLSEYGMATSKPDMTESYVPGIYSPPEFYFGPQGGSTESPNNSFTLIFYDGNGQRINNDIVVNVQEDPIYSITLTQEQWNTILDAPGSTYRVAVIARQLHTPSTGPYYSALSDVFDKPTASLPLPLPTTTLSIASNSRYAEQIVTLQPGQYKDYLVTFGASSMKIIQTFGLHNTTISIYNINRALLASDTGSGYSNNAFLSYSFTANTVYYIRVQLNHPTQSGDVKLVFTPTDTAYSSYESFAGGGNNTTAYSTSVSTQDAAYYLYK